MAQFNNLSCDRLSYLHPDLARLMWHARRHCPVEFEVGEGLRTIARQRQLFDKGASYTLRSRHLTGHAVDILARENDTVSWDFSLYARIAAHVKSCANSLHIAITWGGDWPRLRDGPHFELSRQIYSKSSAQAAEFQSLLVGATGPLVSRLQTLLNHHGARLDIDGIFGPLTLAALLRFKRRHQLPTTYVTDEICWNLLRRPPMPQQKRFNHSGLDISKPQ